MNLMLKRLQELFQLKSNAHPISLPNNLKLRIRKARPLPDRSLSKKINNSSQHLRILKSLVSESNSAISNTSRTKPKRWSTKRSDQLQSRLTTILLRRLHPSQSLSLLSILSRKQLLKPPLQSQPKRSANQPSQSATRITHKSKLMSLLKPVKRSPRLEKIW